YGTGGGSPRRPPVSTLLTGSVRPGPAVSGPGDPCPGHGRAGPGRAAPAPAASGRADPAPAAPDLHAPCPSCPCTFSFLFPAASPRPGFPPLLARNSSPCPGGFPQRDGDGLLPLPDLAAGRRAKRATLVLPHHLLDLSTASTFLFAITGPRFGRPRPVARSDCGDRRRALLPWRESPPLTVAWWGRDRRGSAPCRRTIRPRSAPPPGLPRSCPAGRRPART